MTNMTRPVSIGRRREQRRTPGPWITTTDRSAAIRADRVPDGIRIQTTAPQLTLTPEQAQQLCSQIRNESRKQ